MRFCAKHIFSLHISILYGHAFISGVYLPKLAIIILINLINELKRGAKLFPNY